MAGRGRPLSPPTRSISCALILLSWKMVRQHPEISFAAVTTGATNLVADVNCRDPQDLGRYLTERIAEIPGITTLETAPVIRTIKRAGALLL
ncbi:Lrp/AsnC ligand binding domain-containing protein [Nocardia sp. NBC_00565]|uniref:Lrp/AsnC ligand binding domain-containing protein n=1 Tax=Nocardia sp. NBC_00565 TaxID=2975993 RepID=UPI002E819A6A|nr:Lrp/AsnC ligand binding domain-containing protein [Nocardia sp. NBC_00565]WUC04669.1 Lrp/AsnC ligand binding domain-containing protein [Nocardia sp. NBC_00565]